MVSARDRGEHVSVYYRDHRSGAVSTGEVPAVLPEFIEYLAHRTTPEEPAPGLDLGYSAVVGALAQIVERGGVPAVFVPETDRLALELLRSRQVDLAAERPELASEDTPGEGDGALEQAPDAAQATGPEAQEPTADPASAQGDRAASPEGAPEQPQRPAKRRYVVPVAPPPGSAPAKDADRPAPK